MVFTSILLVILNSNYWFCFIVIFYVYDSKILFIFSIPFIFRFLVLIVTSSYPVTVSLFFSQPDGVVSPSPLLIVIFWLFFWFPHFPWVWPIIRIDAYIQTTFLSNHIVAIYPPVEACFWNRSLQWQQCRRWRPILQRHRTYIPSYCRFQPTRQKLVRIDNMTAPQW